MTEDEVKTYNNILAKFEDYPSMTRLSNSDGEGLRLSAYISIAISLKRIADAICRPPPDAGQVVDWNTKNIVELKS